MQKIVLFIEPNADTFTTPFEICHLFMNRFTIPEEASFEIVNILELGKASRTMCWSGCSGYWNLEEERHSKGMSLST